MFKKKKQEDEWYIDDDDFLDSNEEKTTPINQQNEVKEKYENQCIDSNNYLNKKSEYKPNPLRKRDIDEYTYDEYGDDEIIMDEPKRIAKWKFILPITLIFVLLTGFVGYLNTDFDENGNSYIVPLELHYERKYVKEADELLNLILDINQTIVSDSESLPYNYITISSRLNEQMTLLKNKTTEFSKYVGVPTKFETYHSQIINFSLSTQEFIKKLVINYNSVDYNAFRVSGLNDYFNSFEKLKKARLDIDNIIFRNMEGGY